MSTVTSPSPIRVAIVDDHVIIRDSLRRLIENEPDLVVVGEAGDGAGARALAHETSPDVILLDVAMPGVDGLTALEGIVADGAESRVIVITMFDHDEAAFRALRAGASAFLLKNAPPADILRAVRLVHAGERVVAPELTERLIRRWVGPPSGGSLHSLPDRERETVSLIAEGLSNAEIAVRMVVTETTARTYVSRVLAKSGARDRAQLIVMAFEQGFGRAT